MKKIFYKKKYKRNYGYELERNFENSLLKIHNFIADNDIHISFDVDCLDPRVMPCTGTTVKKGIGLQTAKDLMDSLNSYLF